MPETILLNEELNIIEVESYGVVAEHRYGASGSTAGRTTRR